MNKYINEERKKERKADAWMVKSRVLVKKDDDAIALTPATFLRTASKMSK